MDRQSIVSQLPPYGSPFLDPSGTVSLPWRRFFESQWLRSGGFSDFAYALLLAGSLGDATLAEVAANSEQNALAVSALQARIAGGVLEALQQDNENLRKRLDTLEAIISGGLAESLQQELSDIRQELVRQNAQIQSIRGEDNAANIQFITQTVDGLSPVAYSGAYTDLTGRPTLATVATTGAYSDLSGTPSLGSAAAQNTGTSGANVPLMSGANTWASQQTFNGGIAVGTYTVSAAPPITGYITIKDAGGTNRNVAIV